MGIALGTIFSGRYRLEDRIGSGGMSTVYRAVDEVLQRKVAVKVMNQLLASDSDQLERFRREARAVAQLSHPNVIGVIDAGEDDGRAYIVFEYVDGETLKARIRRLGELPIPEAVAHAIELARALQAAHDQQIVHRDVKPENVLIDLAGTAKVTDFGIARTLDEEGLTADGRVIGTTAYVAPEQALGRPVTARSDLYSLGIVLYEMLAGEVPFEAENQVAVAIKHVREPLPDVRAARPEVSAELAGVIRRATAKDPARRYTDERELIAELEVALALETARAEQPTAELEAVSELEATDATAASAPPVRRTTESRRVIVEGRRSAAPAPVARRRSWLVVLAFAAVLVFAGVVVWLALRGTPRSPSHPPARTGAQAAAAVKLCSDCATAYNPDGYGGATTQNNAEAPLAIDSNPQTAWSTETYYSGQLGKPGVGIYLTAPAPTLATKLTLLTDTPGFAAEVYGSSRTPSATSFAASGWVSLASVASVGSRQTIALSTAAGPRRYFLVWITKLPPGRDSASINTITLHGLVNRTQPYS